MKYPNLAEIIKYHPYHISTFAGFAGVTVPLLSAAIEGKEELTGGETRKIARYGGIVHGTLCCPHLIRLDRHRARHQQMVEELLDSLPPIWEAQKAGSRAADSFMKYDRVWVANLELAFLDGRATYGMYLGASERVGQAVSFIRNENKKPRGLKRRAAG